ncbi:phosphotransferase family protein [Actinomadura physcomitrii]|uniref:phosphotransferase family protein n=1 Tax=Actinomadura physcomitrii TaxID=2650748 RepID=UPI001922897B|nr:phosphotransferase family protein [Actinomadura physcomitrii]
MTARLEDADFVGRWFRHRMTRLGPEVADVRMHDVRRLSRGVSRQTWSVIGSVLGGDGRWSEREYIVRRDHEGGSIIPTSLRTEYEVYRRLNGSAVPTADVLWYEDEPGWAPDGREAYVRAKVPGDWLLPFIADDDPELDEARVAASKEHLDKLALVHTLDWEALGFGEVFAVPPSPAECAETLIGSVLSRLAEFQFEPSPLLAECVAWLRDAAPRDCPRVTLCKGTNGHGEEVWSDGRIVAMSDWELAVLGDPAYDFAQVQEMIPEIHRNGRRVWGLPEALAYHRERTGIEITVRRVEFYRRFYGVLQFLYCHHAAALVHRKEAAPLRFVWTAAEVGYHSRLRLAGVLGIDPLQEAPA